MIMKKEKFLNFKFVPPSELKGGNVKQPKIEEESGEAENKEFEISRTLGNTTIELISDVLQVKSTFSSYDNISNNILLNPDGGNFGNRSLSKFCNSPKTEYFFNDTQISFYIRQFRQSSRMNINLMDNTIKNYSSELKKQIAIVQILIVEINTIRDYQLDISNEIFKSTNLFKFKSYLEQLIIDITNTINSKEELKGICEGL